MFKAQDPSPLTVRLTQEERARLERDAGALSMAANMDRLNQELHHRNERLKADTLKRKAALVTEQRAKWVALNKVIELRTMKETQTRQARFRLGLGGIWDHLRGEHKRIRQLNEQEAKVAAVCYAAREAFKEKCRQPR